MESQLQFLGKGGSGATVFGYQKQGQRRAAKIPDALVDAMVDKPELFPGETIEGKQDVQNILARFLRGDPKVVQSMKTLARFMKNEKKPILNAQQRTKISRQYGISKMAEQGDHSTPQKKKFVRMLSFQPDTGILTMQRKMPPWVTLQEYLETRRTMVPPDQVISPEQLEPLVKMLLSTVQAVRLLHDLGIVHLDIKPGNVFVNPETGDAALLDFDQSCDRDGRVISCRQRLKTGGSTAFFLSPEWVRGDKNVSFEMLKKRDYFALGMLIYMTIFDRLPMEWFPDQIPPETIRTIDRGGSMEVLKDFYDNKPKLPGINVQSIQAFTGKPMNQDLKRLFQQRKKNFYQAASKTGKGASQLLSLEPLLQLDPTKRQSPKTSQQGFYEQQRRHPKNFWEWLTNLFLDPSKVPTDLLRTLGLPKDTTRAQLFQRMQQQVEIKNKVLNYFSPVETSRYTTNELRSNRKGFSP